MAGNTFKRSSGFYYLVNYIQVLNINSYVTEPPTFSIDPGNADEPYSAQVLRVRTNTVKMDASCTSSCAYEVENYQVGVCANGLMETNWHSVLVYAL